MWSTSLVKRDKKLSDFISFWKQDPNVFSYDRFKNYSDSMKGTFGKYLHGASLWMHNTQKYLHNNMSQIQKYREDWDAFNVWNKLVEMPDSEFLFIDCFKLSNYRKDKPFTEDVSYLFKNISSFYQDFSRFLQFYAQAFQMTPVAPLVGDTELMTIRKLISNIMNGSYDTHFNQTFGDDAGEKKAMILGKLGFLFEEFRKFLKPIIQYNAIDLYEVIEINKVLEKTEKLFENVPIEKKPGEELSGKKKLFFNVVRSGLTGLGSVLSLYMLYKYKFITWKNKDLIGVLAGLASAGSFYLPENRLLNFFKDPWVNIPLFAPFILLSAAQKAKNVEKSK